MPSALQVICSGVGNISDRVRVLENIWGLLNRLGMARIAAMVVVAVLLLSFLLLITFRFTAPQMAPLYSGLDFDDSAAIVNELQSMNVPFELRSEGETILVARDQITQIRMTLAQDGLPSRGQVGYEIFDEQGTLGATSFVQNINQLRALEGELARTISSLARIKSARVHLVLPERELFRRERKDPTASIVLGVRGELSSGEIRAIQHLVSSAIQGLSPTRVSIIDDAGRLLAAGSGDENSFSAVASEMEERTQGIETRLRTRIESMLENVLGAGRARVQVSAEIDMNRLTRTSETFDPDGQVVRSSQLRETSNTAENGTGSGAVTVANELPGASDGTANGAASSENSSNTEEVTNFEISKTTETQVTEAGSIRRLSVAVAVDGRYIQDNNGSATYEARSQEEIDQITALVRSASGFVAERGDQVEVINMQFAERPELTGLGSEAPGLLDFTRDDLMGAAEMAVTLIISLALLFFVLRPLVNRVLAPEPEPLALPQSAEVGTAPGAMGEHGQAGEPGAPQVPAKPEWMDQAKQLGAAQAETISDVGSMVEDNPKQASLVVRDWLNRAA